MDRNGRDEIAQLTEAVIGLEQAMGGVAVVLEQQGRMLQRLLDASVSVPAEEKRLYDLILVLIARLNAKSDTLESKTKLNK